MASDPQEIHAVTAIQSPTASLHQYLGDHREKIESWFDAEWQKTTPLFYGSIDIRNAGFKIAPVDTNLFPAGFNNLRAEFLKTAVETTQAYFKKYYPNRSELLVITESHTRNTFYLDNLETLANILRLAGLTVHTATLEVLIREGNRVGVQDFFPDLILLNNDLSSGVPDILNQLKQTFLPPLHLGWHQRLKSSHFKYYAALCQSLAKVIDIDPWLIMPFFDQCNEIDFLKKKGEGCLAFRAEKLLFQIQQKYSEYKIAEKPFLIVKADSGTYGMGVMTIKDPQELLHLNRKQRTKMSASKGGNQVHKAIIQEGVYSIEKWNGTATAEPVLYGIGKDTVGGFYRVHETKDNTESLNAPGMQFYPFETDQSETRFYSYHVIARLALLAAAHEKEET